MNPGIAECIRHAADLGKPPPPNRHANHQSAERLGKAMTMHRQIPNELDNARGPGEQRVQDAEAQHPMRVGVRPTGTSKITITAGTPLRAVDVRLSQLDWASMKQSLRSEPWINRVQGEPGDVSGGGPTDLMPPLRTAYDK